jgi:hypothetical protein
VKEHARTMQLHQKSKLVNNGYERENVQAKSVENIINKMMVENFPNLELTI